MAALQQLSCACTYIVWPGLLDDRVYNMILQLDFFTVFMVWSAHDKTHCATCIIKYLKCMESYISAVRVDTADNLVVW